MATHQITLDLDIVPAAIVRHTGKANPGTEAGWFSGCRCPRCTDGHERRLARRRSLARKRGQAKQQKRSSRETYPAWIDLRVLRDTVVQPDWKDEATCRPRDGQPLLLDIFYPDSVDQPALELADAYCNLCPVAYQCLRQELDEGRDRTHSAGIYAGTSGPMRDRLRRDLRKLPKEGTTT